MRAIGFRAEKDAFNWALVEGDPDNPDLVLEGRYNSPQGVSEADSLVYFRKRVITLIKTHNPTVAAIKCPETFGRRGGGTLSLDAHLRVEGVLIEAVASEGIHVEIGRWNGLGSARDLSHIF